MCPPLDPPLQKFLRGVKFADFAMLNLLSVKY